MRRITKQVEVRGTINVTFSKVKDFINFQYELNEIMKKYTGGIKGLKLIGTKLPPRCETGIKPLGNSINREGTP